MDINNIILITLAAIIALGFSFFQYLYRGKKRQRDKYVFFGLRASTVFILLLLLINPKITTTSHQIEKPNLILAADNSASIAYLNQADTLQNLISSLENNKELQQRFDISRLSFSKDIQLTDSLSFSETQTDINKVLSKVSDIYSSKHTAVVLFTDGNQTLGRDYRYFKSSPGQYLMPVVLGDTSSYADLEINRLNVNRYAFLDNRFPVEVIINYNGQDAVSSRFELRSGEAVLFTQDLTFGPETTSTKINTTLPASRLGVLTYEAVIVPDASEKNIENNRRKFAVEVIDERSRILLLSDLSHPDLGAIKKSVESNRQRELEIKYLDKDNYVLQDYQLVILYQPHAGFREILEDLKTENINSFIVTGTKTDWRFLNSSQELFSKDFAAQSQEVEPLYNSNFSRFQFENIGFNDFPPLLDMFGEIEPNGLDPLLFQKIENVETTQPLLAIAESRKNKFGVLFGEGIWRWRAKAWRDSGSFEEFDGFLGKIIQNLASQKQRERLSLDYESFYYGNEKISISAKYFDENYIFDPGATLNVRIDNKKAGDLSHSQMVLRNNSYVLDLENLPEGEYEFLIKEEVTGISKTGKFNIVASTVEKQFASANLEKLQFFANNNNEQVYFPNNQEALISRLLNDENFIPVQKSNEKNVPLVNWYYLLFLMVLLLAAEWFFRKYRGLI
ncbi:MAG TPA: VWA domain-containing protein [Salegentibacter sp.]|uniref:VWA domain-containing protein n=1 Tax=Salegentibacter sp. TaxID=1903072 RepID=UPI002F950850